jgi:hypothetical protein
MTAFRVVSRVAALAALATLTAALAQAQAPVPSTSDLPPPRAIASELSPALRARMEAKRLADERAAAKAQAAAAPAAPSAKARATKEDMIDSTPAKPGAGVEPVVVARLDKCIECKTNAKRRIAILPARIGSVAADAGTSPDALAQVVGDHMEAMLKPRPGLLVLGRGDLAAVLGEQELVTKGVTQGELGPQRGRVIPAEILLRITLDRVDVRQSTNRVASSNAAAMLQRAQELENAALKDQETAAEHERSAIESAQMAQQMKLQNDQLAAQMQTSAQSGTLSRGSLNLGVLATVFGKKAELDSQRQSEESVKEAGERRLAAQRKLLQARQEKERAERMARTDLTETRTTNATIIVVWRAIDSLTGELIAGDSYKLSDNLVDQRKVQSDGNTSTEVSETGRVQGLVHQLIDQSLEKMAGKITAELGNSPFRGQIVRVDKGGVILNVGKNLDVEVGDTFAVKRFDASLVDPATGQSLAGPGSLEGLIRVVEVSDKTARASVMQSAGKLVRGDTLEWVGVYK